MQVTIPVVQPIIPFNPKIQPLMLSTIGRTSTTSDADVTKFSPPPTIPQNAPILKKSEVKSPSLQVGTPTGSTSHLTTPQVKPPRRPTPEIEPRWIFMDPAQDSHQNSTSELPNKTNMGEFTDVPPMEVTQNAEVHHLNTPVLPNCSAIAEGQQVFSNNWVMTESMDSGILLWCSLNPSNSWNQKHRRTSSNIPRRSSHPTDGTQNPGRLGFMPLQILPFYLYDPTKGVQDPTGKVDREQLSSLVSLEDEYTSIDVNTPSEAVLGDQQPVTTPQVKKRVNNHTDQTLTKKPQWWCRKWHFYPNFRTSDCSVWRSQNSKCGPYTALQFFDFFVRYGQSITTNSGSQIGSTTIRMNWNGNVLSIL